MMRRALVSMVVGCLLAIAAVAAGLSAHASGAGTAQSSVVNKVPCLSGTSSCPPKITNGSVQAIVQVGNRMVVGGTFTSLTQGGKTFSRPYLAAFDVNTGVLDPKFLPKVNSEVDAIQPAADGKSVYVGGRFSTVNGVTSKLARLDLNTGKSLPAPTPAFKPAALNGAINDLALVGGHLLVGGWFTKVGTAQHAGLVSLNAVTGVDDGYAQLQFTGHHNFGRVAGAIQSPTGVETIAVSPRGDQAIVDGNFITVTDGGNAASRDQIARVVLGSSATLDTTWASQQYTNPCYSSSYDFYMRDISWDPTGAYYVVAATGGYIGGSFQNCDTASRFEASSSGQDVKPTWIDWTGTDSLYSVAVTGTAVYVGGHARWLNNPNGEDYPAAGAVPRPGLAALDPRTGVPLSWNPGRNPRAHGAEVVYAGTTGLWVGMDTDYIGNHRYGTGRLAFFPSAGGTAPSPERSGTLPGTVYLPGSLPGSGTSNVLDRVNAAGPTLQSSDSGPDWASDTGDSNPLRNDGSNTAGYGPIAGTSASVPSYVPGAVFSTERWDPDSGGANDMTWTFPVPSGHHIALNLFFANRYDGTSQPGQRVFDVLVDGNVVLDHYDIVADVGDQTGTMKTIDIPHAGSTVTVSFHHEVENPLVDGLEVVDLSQPAAPPGALDTYRARSFNGTTASQTSPNGGGIAWGQTRGAFMLSGKVWYGRTDGNLYYRTYNGTTFGPETLVDPYNDPAWSSVQTGSGQTYRGAKPDFYSEISNVTGMFYADGYLYYSLYQDPLLYRRAFSPDTAPSSVPNQVTGGVVSELSETVATPGVDWSNAAGMFLANGNLYFATRPDGVLHQVPFSAGATTGPPADVSSAGTGWAARGLFVYAP